jgi:DNA polymerase-4
MLRTLFVDFNSYFASVEQQINPALRGRPVGVVPVMAETSCCIAASYEAKAFGIRTGTGVAEARRLCPGIVLIEGKHEVYVDFHQRAVAAVGRIAPVRQVLSIDEMECELTGSWCEREKAVKIAEHIKTEIYRSVGESMRTSIGIAPNTLLGKLASDMHKPNGLTVLEQADIPSKLLHLKPSAITGVGPRMVQRLEKAKIVTMADLYAAPRDVLHTVWGGVGGTEMYDKLRGQWYGPRVTIPRTLGHSHVLPPDMRHAEGAWNVLNRLTQKAAMRLRKQGFYAMGMSVHVQGRRQNGYSTGYKAGGQEEAKFCETQDTAFLLRVLSRLWRRGLAQFPAPVAVGMTLFGLVPTSQHTPTLFEEKKPATKRDGLSSMVDKINRLYGKNALYFASAHQALDHAPMRIAFNRIPDIETEC